MRRILDLNATGQSLWQLRERVADNGSSQKASIAYDFSLSVRLFDELAQILRRRLGNLVSSVNGFGHLGDG